ncbi:MAG: hypothetical protein WC078_05900, partial [Dysgonamonadaceae bacterium]
RFNRSRVRGPYARFCERDKDGIKEYYPIFTLLDLLPCKILPKISSLPFIKVAKKQFSDFLVPSCAYVKNFLVLYKQICKKIDQIKMITI